MPDNPDDTTTDDTAPSVEPTDTDTTTEPDDKQGAEAARYRRRLRDTEVERDAAAADRDRLRGLLDDRQRADVEALAGQRLRDASDLWTATNLSDLVDDEGEVDEAKVKAAVEQLAAAKPHYAVAHPGFDLGVRGAPTERAASMSDVLRGTERR